MPPFQFTPKPLVITCDRCGQSAETWDFQDPDAALDCGCCPLAHRHTGECRPATVYATAHLTHVQPGDLLDLVSRAKEALAAEAPAPSITESR